MRHDTTGTDHCAVSDAHTGKNAYTSANPDIVADGDASSGFQACIARFNIQWVRGCVETDIWTDENMISDSNAPGVKHGQIVVTVKVLTYKRIVAVVKIDGWLKIGVASQMAE